MFCTLLNACSCHLPCPTAPCGTVTRLEIYAMLRPFYVFFFLALASLISGAAERGLPVLKFEATEVSFCLNNKCNCEFAIVVFYEATADSETCHSVLWANPLFAGLFKRLAAHNSLCQSNFSESAVVKSWIPAKKCPPYWFEYLIAPSVAIRRFYFFIIFLH